MTYGFWVRSEANDRLSLALPQEYTDWVEKYKYPTGDCAIHTLDEKRFRVKVMQIAGKWFICDGWKHLMTTLNYPSVCNFVFEYEEVINCFKMITFHQDAIAAPGRFFYCKLDDPQTDEERLHISCFVMHGLYNRTLPLEPIIVSSFPGHVFQIQLENDGAATYITQGWPYMKETFEITKDHLIVFESYNEKTYELTFFKKGKLTLPPHLWEDDDKSEDDEHNDNDIIVVSDDDGEEVSEGDAMDDEDDQSAASEDVGYCDDLGVPVVFTVDNHFRMQPDWARENGMNRQRGLTIKDGEGYTWGVSVGVESSRSSKLYYIKGMSTFAADKDLQAGDQMHFLFFQNRGLLKLSKVVRVAGN